MNGSQWEKMRHNWTELLQPFRPTSSIVNHLFQEGVITEQDKEAIYSVPQPSEKMEKLLFIIKRKVGKDPYRHFMTILQEESPELAEKIESTASESHPNLKHPGKVFAEGEEVRKVLRDHFTDGDDHNPVSLGEIRDTLKKEKAFSKGNEWSNTMLKDYLEKEFLNVEFQTSASSSGKNKRIVVKHIRRLSGNIQAYQNMQPPVLEAKSDQDVADDTKPLYEHPRQFGADVDVTTKYVKGRCFDDVSSHVRGKKTTPIRNYHLVNESHGEDEMLECIGCTLIPFVSACMNERKNGTLYFGVCPKKDDTYRAGEIVGVTIDKDAVAKEIDNRLQTSFLNEQTKYTKVVRHPKFIPVVSGSSSAASWVVEIDVVPSSSLLNNEVIRTKLHLLKMFPTSKKKQKKEYGIFRFSGDGIPRVLLEPEDIEFNRNICDIVQQRNKDEGLSITKTPKSFNKLNRLLTGGTNQGIILDDCYIFLMLSPIDSHMDSKYINENMSFIKNLEPEVVFDFDPNGFAQGVYHTLDTTDEEIFNVYTLDMFDNTKENFKSLLERLQKDNYTQWVFCNGHDNMETLDKRTWNKIRKLQFQEALQAFADNHGKERILLITCLFSKTYEIMISACEEAKTSLPNQWILLAENDDIAKLWQEKMSEDTLEKQELNYNSVLDMSWNQISMTVAQIKEKTKNTDVFLPCSNGSMTPVPTKNLKQWHDIDVLTAGDFVLEENIVDELEQKVELEFYRGEQVSWLNFWFHNQVLQRDIHCKLKQAVEDSLEGKTQDEYRVQYVTLWHQPGAGGTTAAMNVLWDLRTKYRCCRVLNITEETSEHLEEIWHFKEDSQARSPKPLLVLIDYVDDDESIKFKGKLEELGRKNRRHYEDSFDVFCTIIECKRITRPPRPPNELMHNLTERESRWFNKKNELLETKYKIQTKVLFAFNIMRENFSQKYISDVVKEFCNDLREKSEIYLLLIVSFLNEYDLTFKPIKISWLDCFFKNRNSPGVKETISFTRDVKWEANLSPGIKLLMNISKYSRHNSKPRKSLRIINKLVAKEILKSIQLITEKKTSEIMLELCDRKVYNQTGQDANNFRYLINCIAKKREVAENGKKCKFSKFVTDVVVKEGVEVAVNVLIQLFEVSQDAFIAQLISRVYMEMKDWKKAKDFAQTSTFLKPENSYLWDTYGRVFHSQLIQCYTEKLGFAEEDIIKIIKIASEGLVIFQKEQEASENAMTTLEASSIAGYFGELRTILLVLNALKSHPAFGEPSELHRYLTELKYCPGNLDFLHDYTHFLKGLASRARLGMRRLDEEFVQVKSVSGQEERINDRVNLIQLKANLDCFFEETQIYSVPTTLTDREACAYRLSVALSKGASSLNQILELRKTGKMQDIIDCANLLLENIKSPFGTFYDFKAFLDVLTVLIANNCTPPNLKFQKMLDWSKTFYYLEQPKESSRHYLEPMMYFVLYNFPTEERMASNLCTITDLKIAMEKWRDHFKKNYPKQDIFILRKRGTTLFFLGNGPPLQDIVPQGHLEIMKEYNYKEKWTLPEIRKRLRMMTGVLSDDGLKVKTELTTKDGNNITLDILTAYPVNKRMMWNKRVYFYLGFSFSGPKAFGMSLEELGTCRT